MNEQCPCIGFIGAGRVGFTLGRYFSENGLKLSGFYSRTLEHAKEASEFTKSKSYKDVDTLINDSDIIFITVSDGQIESVWNLCKKSDLRNKILCHCSGALSSAVFSGIELTGATGYSVHPIFAVSDKLQSYKEISKAYFTIEGNNERLDDIKSLFDKLGNKTQVISADNKTKYHAAAVYASNLVIGLYHMSANLLVECGFDEEQASQALMPLFINNALNLSKSGETKALTGPVDRADISTVCKHIDHLDGEYADVYKVLSKQLIEIAKIKNPDTDYTKLSELL